MSHFASYNVRTFGDMFTFLMELTREDQSQTATVEQAKRFINEALVDLHMGFGSRLPWCIREDVIVTRAPYTTGTITVTQGSKTISSDSGTPNWDSDDSFGEELVRKGMALKVGGSDEIYRVFDVDSDTQLTLETAYIGDDDTSLTYQLFDTDYDLASDFQSPATVTHFDTGSEVELIGRSDFARRFPKNNIVGKPTHATIIDRGGRVSSDSTITPFGSVPDRQIRFSRPPDTIMQIPYSYVTKNLAYSGNASGSYFFTDNPAATNTLVLNGTTWTIVASGAGNEQTNKGADLEATLDALVTDINTNAGADAEIAKITASRAGNVLWIKHNSGESATLGAGKTYTTAVGIGTFLDADQATLEMFRPQERLIGDFDEPIVPEQYRSAIVDLAAYRWYLHKKDDQRAQIARADADQKLARVIEDNEIGTQRPRLMPRVTRYRRSARNPYSPGVSTRYDINGRFDRLEDR